MINMTGARRPQEEAMSPRPRTTWIIWPTLSLLAFATVVSACGHAGDAAGDAGTDSDSDSDSDSDGDADFDFDDLVVEWETCSLYPGADDGLAECAMVEMPLRWGIDDGQTFGTYAKRLLSSASETEGQLWLLHGGPGASGTVGLPGMMELLQHQYPELDLYTLDARGTGYSEWLGCPEQESEASDSGSWVTLDELGACLDYVDATYGDDLEVYNPTNAAIDLAALIHHTAEPGKNTLIWGGSGGTFWAQRYLQLFPDQADGVVLEGIVPPDESLVFQDEYDDLIARRILEMCTEDPFCSAKLPDPEAKLLGLFDKLDDGHCAVLGIDADGVRSFIRGMDYYYPTNAFTPAFVYRMDRCDDGDIDAIYTFYMAMWGQPGEEHEFSTLLFFNEGWSELWMYKDFADNGELLDYLDGVYEEGIVTFGMGYERNEYYLAWPKYTDAHDDTWAESSVPMLMLQGRLDPSTPHDFAEAVGQHFDGPHQHWTSFPYAPHNVASGSPVDEDPEALHCGQQLFVDFLKDPQGDLDTSCVEQTLPPDFEGAVYAPYLLGTADYWENEPAAKGPSAPPPPALRHTLRQLGHMLRPAEPRSLR